MSKTRIIEAVKALDLPEVKRLLEAKPELLRVWNNQGRNLLHLACSVDCDELRLPESTASRMVAFLLDRGLDIEEEGGSTSRPQKGPVGSAWEDIDILNTLIDAGADTETVVGVTPFLACWGWKRFKAAKALALKGANVNVQDQRGRTALHIGIEKEFDPALLRWLVTHGASPDIPDRHGVTARQQAHANATSGSSRRCHNGAWRRNIGSWTTNSSSFAPARRCRRPSW